MIILIIIIIINSNDNDNSNDLFSFYCNFISTVSCPGHSLITVFANRFLLYRG